MSCLEMTLDDATVGVLKKAYSGFNARDLEGVLALMQPNVEWPNGMEGGTVCGTGGVREYWTRQWGMINPHVDPVGFDVDGAGRVVVKVHQVVREMSGNMLMDRMVEHVYSMDEGLIRAMEIRE